MTKEVIESLLVEVILVVNQEDKVVLTEQKGIEKTFFFKKYIY